jgi:hypothetical protein
MGLFDNYFDPDQFEASGGLLGRLQSLQRQQGLLPEADSDSAPPGSFTWSSAASRCDLGQPRANPLATLQSALGGIRPPAVSDFARAQASMIQPLANAPSPDTAGGRPDGVASDVSPSPIRGGSQYAQAPLGLCAVGPAGCFVGGGLTAAQAIMGGAALGGLGVLILNNERNVRPPAGSRPISETPWSGNHGEIKGAVGASGTDDVRISPTDEVWRKNPDGSWTNFGPASTFTGSGTPSGRRGKDRDRLR